MRHGNPPREMLILRGHSFNVEEARIGKRRLVTAGDPSQTAFSLLDTFDGEVASAGGILIDAGGRLTLYRQGAVNIEQSVSRKPGFVQELAEGPLKHELAGIVSPLRRLLPIGEGRSTSQAFSLVDELDKTQARIELCTLEVDGGRAITMASLEGLRGYDKAFAELRSGILSSASCEPAPLGDVLALLFPDRQQYKPKPDIEMSPDETAFRAANDIICAHITVARLNEEGTIADHDTEFLHDYRVALRKVRSVVSLFKGVYSEPLTLELKARFAALMEPTARLRDLDVYLLERDDYLALVPDTLRPGLRRMFADFADERKAEHQRLARHFRSQAYRREISQLQELFERQEGLTSGPMADHAALNYAKDLIWRRYRKVCKIAGAITDDTPDDQVHSLRIQCKKLRYLLEFFAPLFGDRAKPLVKALKKLQDNLGAFNDNSVQQTALEDFLETLSGSRHSRKVEIAKSVGALIAVLHHRQLEERSRIVDSFTSFDAPATREGFESLFHAMEGTS